MPPIDSKKDKVELVSGGMNVNGEFRANESLTSDSLAPQTEINIPPVAPTTGLTGLDAEMETNSDAFTHDLERKRKESEQAKDTSREDLVSTFRNQLTESEAQVEAEDKLDVSALEQDLIDVQNEINAERMSRRRKVEALEKNPQGLFGGALEDEIYKVERDSIRKEADLSVIALARQGKFDAAQNRADKAVDALMERQEQELEIEMFLFNEHKELFETAEEREFLTKHADREREFEAEKEEMKSLQAAKLEALRMAQMNNAPTSVLSAIQGAETPEDVFSVAGQYGSVDMLDRAIKAEQLANLREDPEALVPTSVIDQGGRKLLINTQTGELIKDFGVTDIGTDEMTRAVESAKIQQIDDLKSHEGLYKAVGPTKLGRFTPLRVDVATGKVAGFTSGVEQLVSGMTLQSLIDAKARGATFGALSEGELQVLAATASKIGSWRRTRDDGTIFYEASQNDFMAELDKISNFAKLDALHKGADPASINVIEKEDGTFWTKNGNGTMTKLR